MRALIALSLGTALLSQTPASRPVMNSGPPLPVFPIAGAPISGEIVTERVETASNGSSPTRRQIWKFYRDTAGRTRFERDLPEPPGLGSLILILDLDAGFEA